MADEMEHGAAKARAAVRRKLHTNKAWLKEFGVGAEALKDAIDHVGTSSAAIHAYLERRRLDGSRT